MKLTTAQESAIKEAALVELRKPEEMLSLLLAEGLTYYFMDREQQWYPRRDQDGSAIHFKEQDWSSQLINELIENCQIKEFINENPQP